MLEIDELKLINAALYVMGKLTPEERDFHKILKIFWFADLKHIKEYGRPITEDAYYKMKDGPVLTLLYDIFKAVRDNNEPLCSKYSQCIEVYGNHMINPLKRANMDYLSGSDIDALDNSIEENRSFTKDELSDKSHGLAWEKSFLSSEIRLETILDELDMQGKARKEVLEAKAFARAFA